ncbi:hypothetical protein GW17_00000391 [Ensete ventricosum]|nr:hypothetical protein GW17_00000391 [Ensete ventricosum]
MGVVEAKLTVKDDAKSSSSPPPPPNFSMGVAHGGLASLMSEEKPLDVVGDPDIPTPADDVGFDQDPESPKKGGEEWVAAAAAAEKGVWPRFPQRPDATECAYYIKTGTCKFGLNCRFNHPPKRRHRVVPLFIMPNRRNNRKMLRLLKRHIRRDLVRKRWVKQHARDVPSPCAGRKVARGWRGLAGDPWAARARERGISSSFPLVLLPLHFFFLNRPRAVDFSLNQPPTAEIDCRRSILVVPPGSGRSTYRSAAGPVCTGRYGPYRSNVSSPKDAEKKQKGTVLKKVEQTEKKVIIFVCHIEETMEGCSGNIFFGVL